MGGVALLPAAALPKLAFHHKRKLPMARIALVASLALLLQACSPTFRSSEPRDVIVAPPSTVVR